jgi:alpha,alpha-trehalose phosphorylase
VPPPEHLFPPDEWRIVEARWTPEFSDQTETAFALSNGYVGVRGALDEGRPSLDPGTFINGFHETWPLVHAEEAHALARTGQTIVNAPDATIIKLYVDDEPLSLPTARVRDYARVLDMQAGILTREFVWAMADGKHVRVRSSRLVSLEHRHVIAMTYEVTLLDHFAPVAISSQVVNRQDTRPIDEKLEWRRRDPRLATVLPRRVLNAHVHEAEGGRILLGYQTTNSRMTLGVGVEHIVDADCPYQTAASVDYDTGEFVLTADAPPGVPIKITKFATYQASRNIPVRELVDRCARSLDRTVRDGLDSLLIKQRENLDRFWDRADVRAESKNSPVRLQQAIRWNLFQVAQASWRAEGAGIPGRRTTASTSWIASYMCCRSCLTRSRGWRVTSCASGTACSIGPVSGRRR